MKVKLHQRGRRVLLLTLFVLGGFLCFLTRGYPFFDLPCVFAGDPQPPPLASVVETENQTTYLGISNGDFYALSAVNGHQFWRGQLSNLFLPTSNLLVGKGQAGLLTALRKQDGHTIWQVIPSRDQESVDSLLTSGESVYALQQHPENLGLHYELQAIRLSDGKLLWSRSNVALLLGVDTQALYVYGFINDTDYSHPLIMALSIGDGHLLWSVRTVFSFSSWDSTAATATPLADQNQLLYVAQAQLIYVKTQQELFALDTRTGKKVWGQSNTKHWALEGSADGQVFLLSQEDLVSLQARDGTLHWRFPFQTSSPVLLKITEDLLYVFVPDSGVFSALRTVDGTLRWNKRLNPEIYTYDGAAMPIVSTKDVVYLLNRTGSSTILALSSLDGHKLWQKTSEFSPVLVAGGTLYAFESPIGEYCEYDHSRAHYFYALQALDVSNGKDLWMIQQHVVAPT